MMSNETRSTASDVAPPWWKATDRSRTERSGSVIGSPEGLARVEGIANRLADEDQQRQHDRHREEGRKPQPWRLEIVLALRDHFTERRRAGRHAEAEEIERGQRGDRAGQDERQEGQCRD